ncbi:MAG: chromosome segregation protein ScpA [Thermoproteota archaeon]|nr:chromosome segregation protein ScpA [Thermoproteota archaeon]
MSDIGHGEQDQPQHQGQEEDKQQQQQQQKEEQSGSPDTKRQIAQPPLNLLFNPSLLIRKDVWNIDIAGLLEMFLRILNATGNRDLRICGLAAVSSSMIYRLKVESIFMLEKIAMAKKGINDSSDDQQEQQLPIPQLSPIELPFRVEPTYPVSVEDLLHMLENMIMELANPRSKRKKQELELEPVETFNFDQYLIKFEKIIQGYEDMIYDIVSADGVLLFKTLVSKMDPIEMARCFIAMLYLAMKRKINLDYSEHDPQDIRMTLVAQS